MKRQALALLLGYIKDQKGEIDRIFKEVEVTEPTDKEKTITLGFYLHNLYCAFEDLFIEIAKTFENRIEDPSRYHRELLKRMSLDIPMIRPHLLSKESLKVLDELRKFRHLFRHAYTYDLDSQKTKVIKSLIVSNYKKILTDLEQFEEFLEKQLTQ